MKWVIIHRFSQNILRIVSGEEPVESDDNFLILPFDDTPNFIFDLNPDWRNKLE